MTSVRRRSAIITTAVATEGTSSIIRSRVIRRHYRGTNAHARTLYTGYVSLVGTLIIVYFMNGRDDARTDKQYFRAFFFFFYIHIHTYSTTTTTTTFFVIIIIVASRSPWPLAVIAGIIITMMMMIMIVMIITIIIL